MHLRLGHVLGLTSGSSRAARNSILSAPRALGFDGESVAHQGKRN